MRLKCIPSTSLSIRAAQEIANVSGNGLISLRGPALRHIGGVNVGLMWSLSYRSNRFKKTLIDRPPRSTFCWGACKEKFEGGLRVWKKVVGGPRSEM